MKIKILNKMNMIMIEEIKKEEEWIGRWEENTEKER